MAAFAQRHQPLSIAHIGVQHEKVSAASVAISPEGTERLVYMRPK